MAYPSLDQYNEALQSPQLVLLDRELQAGSLKTTGLGLPLALCGGFALTYTVNVGSAKRFALRCFHKESAELERRYQAISARLKQLKSPYFLPFEFIPKGIRIQGNIFPIVKMAWASGLTLGEFLEKEHGNSSSLGRLRNALAQLATYLEHEGLAHGDIQPGNVMVSPDGGTIQLIDYDGMFVESLRGSKATELGQLNFQHPKRAATDFNERLDRFSFLSLDIALQALALDRQLWKSSRCDPDALVFRRNDFLDPGSSAVFNSVMKMPTVGTHAKNLAQVAVASFQQIPSLADFLQQKGIPTNVVVFTPHSKSSVIAYQGPYPVCLATDYGSVEAQVGSRIELVGQIHSFRRAYAKNGQPYVFVNFSDWRGKGVKLTIWSDGLQ
ncbi:MAG TPA: serine/threonine protein kinase, partial [Nitrospira sp.]|nr:serine/threonine protein kinase [Nitrospira sp.]